LESLVLERDIGGNVPLKCDRALNSCRGGLKTIRAAEAGARGPDCLEAADTAADDADDLELQSSAPGAGFLLADLVSRRAALS
jgi:hypothetical protein